jgi:hypothetical protein
LAEFDVGRAGATVAEVDNATTAARAGAGVGPAKRDLRLFATFIKLWALISSKDGDFFTSQHL